MSKRKRKCRHRHIKSDGMTSFCIHCGAFGVRSLGPANDSNPQHVRETETADVTASWHTMLGDCDWYLDHDPAIGEFVEVCANGDGWTWDPTRPVAGQYEEYEASQRREIVGECPVHSMECLARRRCTNKCGRLDERRAIAGETAVWHEERNGWFIAGREATAGEVLHAMLCGVRDDE